MKISVSENAKREVQKKCHDGEGEILFREVFNQEAFESNLVHLHETIVRPHSTIGYHLHEGNEEIYYLTEGEGIMTVDGDERRVRPGDAIITHSGSKHGLVNNTDQDLKLLVFECLYKQ
ncbi:MAG TPA: cupin domain-containing protein [Methylomirabilota bacterium]|nr:cupin domain-containing protein [Methylomirabilota bacterium]